MNFIFKKYLVKSTQAVILLVLSLVLTSFSVSKIAVANELPELPDGVMFEAEAKPSPSGGDDSSWWDSIKSFFGFGPKEKQEQVVMAESEPEPEPVPHAVRPTFEIVNDADIPEVKDNGYLLDEFEREKKIASEHVSESIDDDRASFPAQDDLVAVDEFKEELKKDVAINEPLQLSEDDAPLANNEVFAEFAPELDSEAQAVVDIPEKDISEAKDTAQQVAGSSQGSETISTITENANERLEEIQQAISEEQISLPDGLPSPLEEVTGLEISAEQEIGELPGQAQAPETETAQGIDLEIPDLPDIPTPESIRAAQEAAIESTQEKVGPSLVTEDEIAAAEANVEDLIAKEEKKDEAKEQVAKEKQKSLEDLYGDDTDVAGLDKVPGLGESEDEVIAKDDTKTEPEKEKVDSRVAKFREQLKGRLKKENAVPQIDSQTIDIADSDDASILSQEIDNKQLKFVQNEAQVLVLPNDEVVLGELSEEANLELIDFSSYVKLFWKNYAKVKAEPRREVLETFIENYDDFFNNEQFLYADENEYDALEVAFNAIENDNIDDLKVMLNNYAILQLTTKGNNNMLHKAAFQGNYGATKILLMRGIDIRAHNARGANAMTIAQRYGGKHVVYILNRAGL